MIEDLRIKTGIKNEADEELNLFRFELAIDIYRRDGNIVPLTKNGKLLPGYSLDFKFASKDLVTFFLLLGYDPGIVTDTKIIHFQPICGKPNERKHITTETAISSKNDVEVDYE